MLTSGHDDQNQMDNLLCKVCKAASIILKAKLLAQLLSYMHTSWAMVKIEAGPGMGTRNDQAALHHSLCPLEYRPLFVPQTCFWVSGLEGADLLPVMRLTT